MVAFLGSILPNVQIPPVIVLTPNTLPNGTVSFSYNQPIIAEDGFDPYTYTITSGSLPTGLTLSSSGNITGTPTDVNTYNFTVTATDSLTFTGSQSYTIVTSLPVITLSPSEVQQGYNNLSYNATISASGGTSPYTFSVTSGSLPNGLTLSSSGVISGTPTVEDTFNFTITATDANGYTGSQAYSILINPEIDIYNIEYLIIAGGGGGGANSGGGGGAGSLRTNIVSPFAFGGINPSAQVITTEPGSVYTVNIGAGGAAGRYSPSPLITGSNGTDSSISGNFGIMSSFGGGGGGVYDSSNPVNRSGLAGGCGGGSSFTATSGAQVPGGIATGNQGVVVTIGNNGGNGVSGGAGGGGGGIGAAGQNGAPQQGGAGGAGITWRGLVTVGGGGGGRGSGSAPNGRGGSGGAGGGGAGATAPVNIGTSGTTNTGGGGGSGGPSTGGAGGSGIVIMGYPSPLVLATGGTVTQSNGYTWHTFTASGTLNFNLL